MHKPNIMDKDSFFIPSGYDSLTTLKNFDINNHLAMLYEERVPYVKPKNVIKEEEIMCEDTQVFLGKYRTTKKTTAFHAEKSHVQETTTEERSSIQRGVTVNDVNTKEDLQKDYLSNSNKANTKVDFGQFYGSNNTTKNPSLDLTSKPTTSTLTANQKIVYT